jgi:hypothetical protein
MIFGLGFATLLTLVLVPVMLYMVENLKLKLGIKPKHKFEHHIEEAVVEESVL